MESDQTTTTRRRFLGTAAGATGVILATTVLNQGQAAAATTTPEAVGVTAAGGNRAIVGSNFALELGGISQGALRGADGGDTYADVIASEGGQKQIGPPKYEEFSIQFGFALALPFYQWVVDMVGGGEQSPTSGVLLSANSQRNIISARGFENALITEFAIPACDASSKAAGALSLSFAPQSASDLARTGQLTTTAPQKQWLVQNFKLEIDSVDCSKVSKVAEIVIKRNTAGFNTYPNLVVTLGAATLASWKTWFNDFVIAGNNGQEQERSGRLRLLAPNGTELAVLELHHIGIYRLDPEPEPGGANEAIVKATAELYVEAMNFSKLGAYVLT